MSRPRPQLQLPPAQALLLAWVRGEAAPAAWAGASEEQDALALAEVHGLAPLLHEEAQQGRLALPELIRKELRGIRIAELAREEKRARALDRALAALGGETSRAGAVDAAGAGAAAAGAGEETSSPALGESPAWETSTALEEPRAALPPLRVLLLKGAASARTLYAAPELRPRSDLDLLVAPPDRAEALARLERAGYTQHGKTRGTREDEPDWHERTLVDPRDRTQQLDLHFALAQPARHRLDAERLFAAAVREPALGAAARVLPAEEAALVCVHALAVHELSAPLISLGDLAGLLARIDVARLLALAGEVRLRRALFVACALLEQLGTTPLAASPRRHGLDAAHAPRSPLAAAPTAPEPRVQTRGAGASGGFSFCGQRVERDRLDELLAGCALSPLVQGLLRREAAGYDLARHALARPRQLWRKALFIDRPGDAARFAGGHALQGLRRALRR